MDVLDVLCLWLIFVLAFCLRLLLGLRSHEKVDKDLGARAELRVRISGL